MRYNLTLLQEKDGFAGWLVWLDNITNGIFGLMFILSLFIISFAVLIRRTDTKKALLTSALGSSIISVFARIIGFVNDTVMWSCVFILMFIAILTYLVKDR